MKIAILIGTRPEAIKLIPVIHEMKGTPGLEPIVISSGQHQDLVRQTLGTFGVQDQIELDFDEHAISLTDSFAALTGKIGRALDRERPDWIFVQGDTSTSLAGALAGFYAKRKIVHIEAGLRSNDVGTPFPEEINRKLISQLANIHFAPNEAARLNLLKEGIMDQNILVTGNPGIDLLVDTITKRSKMKIHSTNHEKSYILVTIHRREIIGKRLESICRAIRELAVMKDNDIEVVFPVHPNPSVHNIVRSVLAGVSNVTLLPSLEYPEFVEVLCKSSVIISDSGGVQEEATFLEKPLLVLRDKTERTIRAESQTIKLVDPSKSEIISTTIDFLERANLTSNVFEKVNSYSRISPEIVKKFLKFTRITQNMKFN